MKLSLILATVGRSDDVARFIDSIISQSSRAFELIVVDQNADDRLLPHVHKAMAAGLSVIHLRLPQPSLSGARNLGLKHAKGALIAFPDDDCWYEPDVVANVLAAFEANPGWRGVIGEWVEQTAGRGCASASGVLLASEWRNFRGGDASSISLFLRASLVQELEGFDERLGVGRWFGAGEETDFILRALRVDAVIGRCPLVRVHHRFWVRAVDQPGLTWRAVLRRARGAGALYVKHQLPWPVVLRGMLSPPVKAVWHWQGARAFGFALAMSMGRIQGALKWTFAQR